MGKRHGTRRRTRAKATSRCYHCNTRVLGWSYHIEALEKCWRHERGSPLPVAHVPGDLAFHSEWTESVRSFLSCCVCAPTGRSELGALRGVLRPAAPLPSTTDRSTRMLSGAARTTEIEQHVDRTTCAVHCCLQGRGPPHCGGPACFSKKELCWHAALYVRARWPPRRNIPLRIRAPPRPHQPAGAMGRSKVHWP